MILLDYVDNNMFQALVNAEGISWIALPVLRHGAAAPRPQHRAGGASWRRFGWGRRRGFKRGPWGGGLFWLADFWFARVWWDFCGVLEVVVGFWHGVKFGRLGLWCWVLPSFERSPAAPAAAEPLWFSLNRAG